MANQRVVLAGSNRDPLPGLAPAGAPDPAQQIQITVMLHRRAPLPATAPETPLTREEFSLKYGADPADIAKVEQFAADHGLTVVSADETSRKVVLGGTIAALSAAFEANLHIHQGAAASYRVRTGNLTLPAQLEGVVEGVFGFDERPQAQPHYILPRATAGTSFTPLQLAQIYNFPAGVNGAGQTIGIIELGGGYDPQDLSNYFSGLGIATPPTVTSVSVDGGQNLTGQDPNGADGEVELDIEVAGAVAPGASIVVYFAPNTNQGFLDAITTAVHDQTNHINVISISWGGAESTWTGQALNSFDQAFQDAGALGITVCVASGDDGSNDNQNDGQAHVDFPAASPNVLACGGTSLQAPGGTIQNEVVWNNGQGQGASGGGISETFPIPSYQSAANVPVSVNSGFAGRGVPDVAGDADPGTGYQIIVDGQSLVIGGTSAVAPLYAGLIALINQTLGKPVGFLNPSIYASASAGSEFNDVTSGDNGAYSAGPGWDACTGWGSPKGAAILQSLQPPA
jgi:kumamolisin